MQPRAALAEGAARRPSTQVVPPQSAQEALTQEVARPSTQKAAVDSKAARPSATDRHGKLYGSQNGERHRSRLRTAVGAGGCTADSTGSAHERREPSLSMQPRATLAEGAAQLPSTQVVPRQPAQEALTQEAARPLTQTAVVESEAARPSATDRHGKLYGSRYGERHRSRLRTTVGAGGCTADSTGSVTNDESRRFRCSRGRRWLRERHDGRRHK